MPAPSEMPLKPWKTLAIFFFVVIILLAAYLHCHHPVTPRIRLFSRVQRRRIELRPTPPIKL